MNALIVNLQRCLCDRVEIFIREIGIDSYSATSKEEMVEILDKYAIDLVILELKTVYDVGLLKYINDNYKNIKVILMVENYVEEVISAIKTGNFLLLKKPFKLIEFKKYLNNMGEEIG